MVFRPYDVNNLKKLVILFWNRALIPVKIFSYTLIIVVIIEIMIKQVHSEFFKTKFLCSDVIKKARPPNFTVFFHILLVIKYSFLNFAICKCFDPNNIYTTLHKMYITLVSSLFEWRVLFLIVIEYNIRVELSFFPGFS